MERLIMKFLALVFDAGIKECEATFQLPASGRYGELHTVLVGMRDQAAQLAKGPDARREALFAELLDELWPDEEARP